MGSVAGRAAASTDGHPPLDTAVVQRFYDRMRAVAPAALGAIERDRADDPGRPFDDTSCGRLLGSLDPDGVRALGMWVHHWCMRFYDDDTRPGLRLLREIASRPALGWTPDEVRWMLRESHAAGPAADDRFTLPLAAAAELPPGALPGAVAELPPGALPAAAAELPPGVLPSAVAVERRPGAVRSDDSRLAAGERRSDTLVPRQLDPTHRT
ncbi:hypothetical protein Jiend_37500 [Micromonospora endophytica]|nr:hypothetical protein Jiend_37500 [Micromonospora endophytica]